MNRRFRNKPVLFDIDKRNFKHLRKVEQALIEGESGSLEITDMIKKLTPWLAAAAAATLFTAPALADTSADLQKCRSALTEEGHFDTDRQSLKFSYRKGNSHKRTVYMTLRNKQNANRQQVACKLERQHITGLTLIPGT